MILWRLVGNFKDTISGSNQIIGKGDFEANIWSDFPNLPQGVPGPRFPLPGFAGWDWSQWTIYLKWNHYAPLPTIADFAMFNMNGKATTLTNPAWIASPYTAPFILIAAPTATIPITPALVGEPEPEVVLPPIDPVPVDPPTTVITPVDVPVSIPIAVPVEAPVTVPVTAPVVVEEPIEEPVAEPVSFPFGAPVPIYMEEPVAAPISQPITVPVEAPVAIPITIPVEAPVAAPVATPITIPIAEPVTVVEPVSQPITVPVAAPIAEPITPPISPPPTSTPVSIPISAPIFTPVLAPVTTPVAAPGVAGTCNVTGAATQCRYFPGWHGLDCGCELRPVMDCVENIGGNNWKVWWGYKVWCRDGCRRPEFIRQPYGWGNRFFPGSSKRTGQPDTFCTANRQYSKVFSSTVTYNPKSFFGSLTFEAWVLGHRVALVVPSSFRNKQCSASSSTPTSSSGGNGHHHRQVDSEFFDSESELVGKDQEEYDGDASRLARADEFIRTMTSATGYTAGYTVSYKNPVPFIGRATCRNFVISGASEVSACFNVTLEDGTVLKSACTVPDYENGGFRFQLHTSVPRSQVFSKYYLDARPAVPGRHFIQASYACEATPKKTSTTTIVTSNQRALVATSSASSLNAATGLILALFALCVLFF